MAQRVIDSRDPASPMAHVLTNMLVDVDGDKAKAWSRWMLVVPGPDGTMMIRRSGSYDDQLVRIAEGWKFARRVVNHDVPLK
jgi:hypothetical protein